MRRERIAPIADINVTNLVDVALVLLIVFIIAAPAFKGGIPVRLPRASAPPVPAGSPVLVTLDAEGGLFVDQKPVPPDDLRAVLVRIRIESPGRPVLLEADQALPYGRVIEVMDRIRRADIPDVGLVVSPGPVP